MDPTTSNHQEIIKGRGSHEYLIARGRNSGRLTVGNCILRIRKKICEVDRKEGRRNINDGVKSN